MVKKTIICLLFLPLVLCIGCSRKETFGGLARKWHETRILESAFVNDSLVGSSFIDRYTKWNLHNDGTGGHEVWKQNFKEIRWSTNADVDSLFVTEFIESTNPSFEASIDWIDDDEILLTYRLSGGPDYYYLREITLEGGY